MRTKSLFSLTRILANNFALSFLFVHRKSFITHSFTKQEAEESGTTRSHQRFEQCIKILESSMQPAMQAMFARKYFSEDIQKAVEPFIRDALDDVMSTTGAKLHRETADPHISHLRSLKLIIMFHEDILNETFVERIYKNLSISESQPLFAMIDLLSNFHEQLQTTDWFLFFEGCCIKDEVYTSSNEPILCKRNLDKEITSMTKIIPSLLLNRRACQVHALSLLSSKSIKIFQHGNNLLSSGFSN